MQGLGLRRIGHTVELPDTPETRGMIHKVRHLVTVQEVRSTWICQQSQARRRARSTRRSASAAARARATARPAGRGHKGAKSRSGFKHKRGFEGGQMPLHRRVPKRGFHNPFRVEYEVVNLDTLAERFEAGVGVTPELLRERGLVGARDSAIKVLARGDIAKALTVQAHKFSGKAAEKIAAAGGTAEVLVVTGRSLCWQTA